MRHVRLLNDSSKTPQTACGVDHCYKYVDRASCYSVTDICWWDYASGCWVVNDWCCTERR